MQQKKPTYPGAVTDENIRLIFRDAADFVRRELHCGEFTLYAYAIDGLVASGAISDYVLKPITEDMDDIFIGHFSRVLHLHRLTS